MPQDPFAELREPVDPAIRRENDTFIFDFKNLGITCELSRLERGKAEAHALLFVRTTLPGLDPIVSFDKRLNLTPASGFTTPAKYLASRLDLHSIHGVTWESILERIAGESLLALRDPGVTVLLGTLPPRSAPLFAVAPLALWNERTILYGDGGTGKSTLALVVALAYRTGSELAGLRPHGQGSVMYLDWESDAEMLDWRLRALVKGFGIEGDFPFIAYKQCFQPLVEIADSVGRELHDLGIGMVVVDSATWAVAGSAKDDDVVLPMFNAMRRWGVHVLVIDHVSGEKAKEADRPYGSVFKRNAGRLLWNVRKAESDEDLRVGLYSSKGNYTGKQKPVGFRMQYFMDGFPVADEQLADEIRVTREDVQKQATMTSGPASSRIVMALREVGEPLDAGELAALTGLVEKTTYNTAKVMVKSGLLKQVVESGEKRRWRLPD